MSIRKLPNNAKQHVTAGPYSPCLQIENSNLVLLSGQAAVDLDGKVVGETIEEQTRFTMQNCLTQLQYAGCTFDNVVEVTVYMTDLAEWDRFNAVYKEYFTPPFPTRTAIGVNLLPGFKVEITMRAIKNS